MSAAIAAASVAAVTGAGAYLNAKYHIGQDVKTLRQKKEGDKHYAELGECSLSTARAHIIPSKSNNALSGE
jgi:hypothetical protein